MRQTQKKNSIKKTNTLTRWTTQQKEIMGHKRKMANGMKVSLSIAPWEKNDRTKNRD